jgi:hypothetical protein
VVSKLKDLCWALSLSSRQCQKPTRMVMHARSVSDKPSDLITSSVPSMEQQFASFTADIHASNVELSQRISDQEARNDYKFERLLGEFQSLKTTVTLVPHSPPYRQTSPIQPRSHQYHSTYPHSDFDTYTRRQPEHEFQQPRTFRTGAYEKVFRPIAYRAFFLHRRLVYFKLQPYRQNSVSSRVNQKLSE